MVLATRAGYDPYGLPTVIQTLQDISAERSGLSLLYSTHPTPADRLLALDRNLGNTMENYGSQATLRELFATMILGSQPNVPASTTSAPTSDPVKKPPAKKVVPAKP